MRALENELLLTAKQLDEERSRQRELKKKVDEVEEEKGMSNQEYEVKIAQVQADVEELKNRLVEVTRYGDSKSSYGLLTLVKRFSGFQITAVKEVNSK